MTSMSSNSKFQTEFLFSLEELTPSYLTPSYLSKNEMKRHPFRGSCEKIVLTVKSCLHASSSINFFRFTSRKKVSGGGDSARRALQPSTMIPRPLSISFSVFLSLSSGSRHWSMTKWLGRLGLCRQLECLLIQSVQRTNSRCALPSFRAMSPDIAALPKHKSQTRAEMHRFPKEALFKLKEMFPLAGQDKKTGRRGIRPKTRI